MEGTTLLQLPEGMRLDQIQVTEAVYECLKNEFAFERRGLIEVKGKGPTLTYLLTGPLEKAPATDFERPGVSTPTT